MFLYSPFAFHLTIYASNQNVPRNAIQTNAIIPHIFLKNRIFSYTKHGSCLSYRFNIVPGNQASYYG